MPGEATMKQFWIYDPRIRKGRVRSVGTKKRTEEEVAKIGEDWLAQMKEEINLWKEYQKGMDKTDMMIKEAEFNKPVPFHCELPTNGGCSFLLLGSGRSGKSTFMKWLYHHYFKKHITVCMTMSSQAEMYKDFNKGIVLCPEYKGQIINDMYQINKETKNHYDFLAIVDDCPITKNDKELMKTLTIYRNSGISAIISNQELSLFNATARSNITFACLFRLNSDMAIEKCVKSYLRSYFPSSMNLNEMIRSYRKLTEDHHFFFINNLTGQVVLTKINP
jgi:hypothetical protein